jgi:type VI secretion system secreted protein VgrG
MGTNDYSFAWEGANHPEGPWNHLFVLGFKGREALSEPYGFDIDLLCLEGSPEVGVTDLVGKPASLRIVTDTTPAHRIIHGIVASAEELGEIERGTQYRVTLAPPLLRATMMRKSVIYLKKTLRQIIDAVLTRSSWGAGLELSSGSGEPDDGDETTYHSPRQTYAWHVIDLSRLEDPRVRPYCVQYDESDFAFVSRLLEEEGIAYHFEHSQGECSMVLSDYDGGRPRIEKAMPLGPGILGREVQRFRIGNQVRPKSASLNDTNWHKPKLNLVALSPSGVTEFQTHEYPGRYEHSRETGEKLAAKREQRFDTERAWAAAETGCRLLSAGLLFTLDHPHPGWNGDYLVTAITHHGVERGSFASHRYDEPPYRGVFEAIRCGVGHSTGESNYRPARTTPRPRILGSQTAIVTADPSMADAEINVGGDDDIGCVRIRFPWDLDTARQAKEPSSCWVRVSQTFAGSGGHGALWNPRVGNEVLVDFLDGDPDRPIITGRVYNGMNLPPEKPSTSPTYSAIKSFTSPFDGKFNLLAFEDAAGKEQITLHAARDYAETVGRNSSRGVGIDDATKVGGAQSVSIVGDQSTTAASISMTAKTTWSAKAGTNLSAHAGANLVATADADVSLGAGVNMDITAVTDMTVTAGAQMKANAGGHMALGSPLIDVEAEAAVRVKAPFIEEDASGFLRLSAPLVIVKGPMTLINAGNSFVVNGGEVTINGSAITVNAKGKVTVKGSEVDVVATGNVNVTGGVVNLNA